MQAAPFHEALYRVFSAKVRGEAAPGVGVETDFVLINPEGAGHLPPAVIPHLRAIYEAKRALDLQSSVYAHEEVRKLIDAHWAAKEGPEDS